nr:2,3-bisphosphoglycerate-dependent phosphoglycerate mutase [Nitrosomonas ureae]
MNKRDYRYPGNQSDYATIDRDELPMGESMQQTLARLKPYWQDTIQPEVGQGKHVLIVSHRNTLRALMMLLDHLTPAQVMKLKLATGRPLVYELDQQCNALRHYYIDKLV